MARQPDEIIQTMLGAKDLQIAKLLSQIEELQEHIQELESKEKTDGILAS